MGGRNDHERLDILIGDDTLLDEVSLDRNQVESLLSSRLKHIRTDLCRADAEVYVLIVEKTDTLRNLLNSKRWDFIALDNNWDTAGSGLGQFGFDVARVLRTEDGPNRQTPLCIFTRHDWLESPENISKIYALDESIGSVGSFADFFPKPERRSEDDTGVEWLQRFGLELLVRMKACFLLRALTSSNEYLHTALVAVHGLVGCSQQFQSITRLCRQVGPSDATVLLRGETGTGKELFAKYVHRLHPTRCTNSFVAMNCAALPETLLESELFGHEKGAFTGATFTKIGLLEEASEGTLFMDEIGEMPPVLQAKLLRVMENGSFRRVGATGEMFTNARVIAATHRDLVNDIADRRFRSDLYYRLNTFPIGIAPLRERSEDIPLLAEHFLERFRSQNATSAVRFEQEALGVRRQLE